MSDRLEGILSGIGSAVGSIFNPVRPSASGGLTPGKAPTVRIGRNPVPDDIAAADERTKQEGQQRVMDYGTDYIMEWAANNGEDLTPEEAREYMSRVYDIASREMRKNAGQNSYLAIPHQMGQRSIRQYVDRNIDNVLGGQ